MHHLLLQEKAFDLLCHIDPQIILQRWKEEGFDINTTSPTQENLLTCLFKDEFLKKNHPNFSMAVQTLLDEGIEVNGTHSSGNAFLFDYLVVYEGWGKNLNQILEKTTQVNQFNKIHKSYILDYVRIHHPLSIPLSLKHGANPNEENKVTNQSILMNIIKDYPFLTMPGHAENLKSTAQKGHLIGLPQHVDDIVRSLIEHGADLHFKNKNNESVWDCVIEKDNPDFISDKLKTWIVSFEEKKQLNDNLPVALSNKNTSKLRL